MAYDRHRPGTLYRYTYNLNLYEKYHVGALNTFIAQIPAKEPFFITGESVAWDDDGC